VDPEPDGMDEVFLPRDTGSWNPEQNRIENTITDDELCDWLSAIVGKGTFVFFVVDSCHSGTISRGGDEIERRVFPDELNVPVAATGPVNRILAGGQAAHDASDWFAAAEVAKLGAGLVALYAAQSHQVAIEQRFTKGGPKYGRLCHTMCAILEQCDNPISYRELYQQLLWQFTQEGWVVRSTPGIEGTDLTREILGTKTWLGRHKMQMSKSATGYSVRGGVLHGITTGSILAVYPPAGKRDEAELLGHVRITEARSLSSEAEPFAFKGQKLASKFPALARCEVVYRNLGEMRLTLDVQAEGFDKPEEAEPETQAVRSALEKLEAEEDSLIRLFDDERTRDWVAVITPVGVYLQRGSSSRTLDDPVGLRTGEVFGPRPNDPGLEEWFRSSLFRIAQAVNLRRLAERHSVLDNALVDIEVTVTRDGQRFAPMTDEHAVVRDGDELHLSIKNLGKKAISLAVFYIQNDFAIKTFFPIEPEDFRNNTIDVNGTLPEPLKCKINDETLGWEHVIVIAVDHKDRDVIDDLMLLEQDSIASRSRGISRKRGGPLALASPLGWLVNRAMSGGSTRASNPPPMPIQPSYVIRRISWDVREGEQSLGDTGNPELR
jgi:hypothetical protein